MIPFRSDQEISLSLSELRTAFTLLTQEGIGARLGTSQAAVAAFEGRTDVKLSKLKAYLRALNAELEITARFRSGHTVRLKQFLAEAAVAEADVAEADVAEADVAEADAGRIADGQTSSGDADNDADADAAGWYGRMLAVLR